MDFWNATPTTTILSEALILLVLPLGLLWCLHYWSRPTLKAWKTVYLLWVIGNLVLAGVMFDMEMTSRQSPDWHTEDVVATIFIVGLPLLYSLLGAISYYWKRNRLRQPHHFVQ